MNAFIILSESVINNFDGENGNVSTNLTVYLAYVLTISGSI